MPGFTKLSSRIITSTVWQEDSDTRVVWITMLALADSDGRVDATVPGLANIANVSIEATRQALKIFLGPDPDSRTKDFDGRRIEPMDGGWLLLNHAKHRAKRDPEERRTQNREAKRRQRAKSAKSQQCQPESAHTEAEAEAEAEAEKKQPCANEQRFARFWDAYPQKKGKMNAWKWWKRNKPDEELLNKMLAAITAQKAEHATFKTTGQWHAEWKHGPTWLNGGCWTDAIEQVEQSGGIAPAAREANGKTQLQIAKERDGL